MGCRERGFRVGVESNIYSKIEDNWKGKDRVRLVVNRLISGLFVMFVKDLVVLPLTFPFSILIIITLQNCVYTHTHTQT